MKKIIISILILFSVSVVADDSARLKDLISKEISLRKTGGSLSDKERKEKSSIISKVGILASSQILEEVVRESAESAKKEPTPAHAFNFVQVLNEVTKKNESEISSNVKPEPSPSPAPAKQPKKQGAESEDESSDTEEESPDVAISAIDEIKNEEALAATPEAIGAVTESQNVGAKTPTEISEGKEPQKSIDSPAYSEQEKEKLLKKDESPIQVRIKRNTQVGRDVAASFINNKGGGVIYEPIPKNGIKRPGATVERGSINIVKDYIGTNDSYSVEMCIDSGLTIILEDKKMELQDVILTDAKVFFDAKKLNNNLGVFVRQIDSVPEGHKRETDLYMFRKSDDKPYLIKITGLPCPRGKINFPKILYLKDRENKEEAIKENVLPAEDMVVEVTKGYKRVNEDKINVYDLNVDSASTISMIAIEIVTDRNVSGFSFSITNNVGTQEVPIDSVKYMEKSSKIKAEQEGKRVFRYLLYPKLNKDYVLARRHINIFTISDEKKTYQHLQQDLLPKFIEKTERQE